MFPAGDRFIGISSPPISQDPSIHPPHRSHGGQTENPNGERKTQQEHHTEGQRGQDREERHGGEVIGRSLVTGSLHLRGLRVSNLPDHPEHQDGHVKSLPADDFCSPVKYNMNSYLFFFFLLIGTKRNKTTDFT